MKLKKLLLTIIYILQTLVIGCAISPPIIAPNNGRSAIAIKIWMDTWSHGLTLPSLNKTSGIQRIRPEYIFFIKLNSIHDTFKKKELFVSNYYYQSIKSGFQMDTVDSFCMNVEPGIYAVVGAVGIGQTSGEQYIIFFPKNMIETTITVVQPDTITFMGEYVLDRFTTISIRMEQYNQEQPAMGTEGRTDQNDPQMFYFNNHLFDLLMLNDKESVISKYRNLLPIMASMYESNHTDEAEIEFLNKHIKTFENSDWILKLKNRQSMLKK